MDSALPIVLWDVIAQDSGTGTTGVTAGTGGASFVTGPIWMLYVFFFSLFALLACIAVIVVLAVKNHSYKKKLAAILKEPEGKLDESATDIHR
jgi:hypothetical protein